MRPLIAANWITNGLTAQRGEIEAIAASVAKSPLADVLYPRDPDRARSAGVAAKASAAWRAGLLVIIRIGETQSQRNDGNALSVCADQIAGSMPEGVTSSGRAVAY